LLNSARDANLDFYWKLSGSTTGAKELKVEVFKSTGPNPTDRVAVGSPVIITGANDWAKITIDDTILKKDGKYFVKWTYTATNINITTDKDTAYIDDINVILNGGTDTFNYPAGTNLDLSSSYIMANPNSSRIGSTRTRPLMERPAHSPPRQRPQPPAASMWRGK